MTPPSSLPASLGRYAVRRRIGSGGFATVWLAYDEQLDSPVAIKVLADNWTEDSHVRRRFVEEGRYLRKVDSPHVVSVYDAGELDDGRPYLVMTYADQGTLADRLEKGPLDFSTGIDVIRQVGLGLVALHKRDVLHRDVKPANVLFRTDDSSASGDQEWAVRAMLGDLGLGKALDMSSRLTMIAGTPSYVAPEQAQGERIDARADQFSLGALTYLALTGRPAYSHASLAAAASPQPPPPMGSAERPFPAAVEAVVRRALAVDREERYPDVRTYLDRLVAAAAGEPAPETNPRAALVDPQLTQVGNRPSPRPKSAPALPETAVGGPRSPWPGRIAVGALAVLVLAVGAGAGWAGQREWHRSTVVTDARGSISVAVPEAWTDALARDGWTPPGEEHDYPAVSVGSADDRPGLFVGLLPGDELPEEVPGHPECATTEPEVTDVRDGDPSVTVVHTGCAMGEDEGVVVERIVQVTGNRLLWVQVRSEDRATANQVLDAVAVHGM